MQAVELSTQDAVARIAAENGLVTCPSVLSRELLAAVMRGQLARMYPCPPSALLAATRTSLDALTQDKDALIGLAADVLEDLHCCGDVVELASVTLAQTEDRSHWLFPAPPGFVVRGQRAYLFGVGPDNAPFLPGDHWQRIRTHGAARFLDLAEADALTVASLVALGLRRLDEKEWLGEQRKETAVQHVEHLRELLRRHGVNGHLPGMKVLAQQGTSRQSYQRRWAPQTSGSGLHVVRLDQPHGAPLWYVADLNSGRCVRSLILPSPGRNERACDQAWRAQLAIDATQSCHANYSVERKDGESVLRLDFPLPLAGRRRLLFLNGSFARGHDPYAFTIPSNDEHAECRWLEECLWFRQAPRLKGEENVKDRL